MSNKRETLCRVVPTPREHLGVQIVLRGVSRQPDGEIRHSQPRSSLAWLLMTQLSPWQAGLPTPSGATDVRLLSAPGDRATLRVSAAERPIGPSRVVEYCGVNRPSVVVVAREESGDSIA
jgi:hypothetical protein